MMRISNKMINKCKVAPERRNWYNISKNYILTESFIREFQNYVDWDCISYNQQLSELFIREFIHKINWDNISIKQILSESFIREFQEDVNWYYISLNQNLSESIVNKFTNKIDLLAYLQNIHVIPSFFYIYRDYFSKELFYNDKYDFIINKYYEEQIKLIKSILKPILPKECIKMITSYLWKN